MPVGQGRRRTTLPRANRVLLEPGALESATGLHCRWSRQSRNSTRINGTLELTHVSRGGDGAFSTPLRVTLGDGAKSFFSKRSHRECGRSMKLQLSTLGLFLFTLPVGNVTAHVRKLATHPATRCSIPRTGMRRGISRSREIALHPMASDIRSTSFKESNWKVWKSNRR